MKKLKPFLFGLAWGLVVTSVAVLVGQAGDLQRVADMVVVAGWPAVALGIISLLRRGSTRFESLERRAAVRFLRDVAHSAEPGGDFAAWSHGFARLIETGQHIDHLERIVEGAQETPEPPSQAEVEAAGKGGGA